MAARPRTITIDGMTTATINGMQGGSITFRVAQAYVSEIAVTTGGGTAESSYGNMITNVIPKEGGNTFSGSFYAEYTDKNFAASNLTDELRGYGFTPRQPDEDPEVPGGQSGDSADAFSATSSGSSLRTRTTASSPSARACTTT